MRWWGWGHESHEGGLPESADDFLREEVGSEPGDSSPRVSLEDVHLADPALPARAREALASALEADAFRDDREARVLHAAGRSYPDLIRLRSGEGLNAPDAVLQPASAEQVKAVLDVCVRERVAVVPFGGGTSVVGGVEPLRDGFAGVVSLDLRRLDRLLDVDRESLTATLEGGLLGPEAEAKLGEQGLTLGHFPQSFEFSTGRRLGGHALRRPGVHRVRAHRRPGRGRAADLARRRARHARGAGLGGRPGTP